MRWEVFETEVGCFESLIKESRIQIFKLSLHTSHFKKF
jgi:hypothetical protein